MLQLDFKNAFNEISRAVIIKEIRKKFPAISPWTRYCYDGTKAQLWAHDFNLRSVTGVQQGDPLGPFLFSAALQPIIKRIVFKMHTLMNSADDLTAPSALLFFLDDGVVIGPHAMLAEIAKYLMSDEVKSFGLHLKPSGTRVWWPSPPTNEDANRYPAGIQIMRTSGTTIVGIPIGDDSFVEQEVITRADSIGQLLQVLRKFDDAHAAFSLARACFGTCRMNYLLRTIPSTLTKTGAKRFDEHLFDFAKYLAGGILPSTMFRELTLPVKIHDDTLPHAGTGLTSATDTAAAAFLASLSSAASRMPQLATISSYDDAMRNSLTRLLAHNFPSARAAYDEYLGLTPPAKAPTFESFFGSENEVLSDVTYHSQHEITDLVHSKIISDIHSTPSDPRTKAMRQSFALPKAKEWLKCIPAPALRTHIPHAHFMLNFSFLCRNRRPVAPRCPRRRCFDQPDIFGDHLLCCAKPDNNGRALAIHRHDKLVRIIAKTLVSARRSPVVEPRRPQTGECRNSRPDILAHGALGGEDHFDVSVTHVFAPSKIQKGTLGQLRSVTTAKRRQHQQRIARTPGARLVPLIFAANGGWLPESREYFDGLLTAIQIEERGPAALSRNIAYQQIAASLASSLAHMLTAGLDALAIPPPARQILTPRPGVNTPGATTDNR